MVARQIDVTDWVQAGRYAVGLDPLTAVGGPTSAVAQALAELKSPVVQKDKPLDASGTRTLSVGNVTAIDGLTTTLTVSLASQGDESALTFSLNFDPAAFQYAGVSLGSATPGATLCVNTNQLAGGKLGLALALPIGNSFPGGSCEIVKVSLVPASGDAQFFRLQHH